MLVELESWLPSEGAMAMGGDAMQHDAQPTTSMQCLLARVPPTASIALKSSSESILGSGRMEPSDARSLIPAIMQARQIEESCGLFAIPSFD